MRNVHGDAAAGKNDFLSEYAIELHHPQFPDTGGQSAIHEPLLTNGAMVDALRQSDAFLMGAASFQS